MKLLEIPADLKEWISFAQNNFRKHDRNEDDELSFEELLSLENGLLTFLNKTMHIQLRLDHWMIQKTQEILFNLIDAENNNKISLSEINHFGEKVRSGRIDKLLEQVVLNEGFAFLDVDKNGYITTQETLYLMKNLGIENKLNPLLERMAIKGMFISVDKNQDKRISKTELAQAVHITK